MRKQKPSYQCFECKTIHTEDNMVAYCAICFTAGKRRGSRAAKEMIEHRRTVVDAWTIEYIASNGTKWICPHDLTGDSDYCQRWDMLEQTWAMWQGLA